MKTMHTKLYDVSAELDQIFGPKGSESRISTFYRLVAAMGLSVQIV